MTDHRAEELAEKIAQLSVDYGKAELWHKMCQALHKHYKAARVHATGNELEEVRARYQEAKLDETKALNRSNQLRSQLFSTQHELVHLSMKDPEGALRILGDLKPSSQVLERQA